MKKSRGILVLILTAIVTVFFCYTAAVGIGPTGTGAMKNIKTGLDLAGGVSITYQAKDSNPSSEDMSDTVYKLQKRVEQYSTEAQVYQEGSDRINVEIPGVTDANAILEELGQPGSLCFITQQDEDGNANFQADSSSETGYSLARSLDEIRAAGSVVLEGTDVADATGGAIQQQNSSSREYVVDLTLTDEGKTKFAEATQNNVGKQIAIIYDNGVLSAPRVNEAITGGKAQISGMESVERAQELASYIRIGSLSLELTELRSSVVAAQLGEEAISTSLIAGLIGLIIVILFMVIAYRVPGAVAGLSLIFYTATILLTLNAFDITLTLPGIAGIILGIGMAVDANVIIYARIREEIGAGVSVRNSIKSGFSKAFSAIFDGNITTLIASVVLMAPGSGTVKGFAYTLMIGIILSLFTAMVVTRYILYSLYALGLKSEKLYGRAKERKSIDFIGKKAVFFTISGIIIAAGLISMGVHSATEGKALNYGLDFMGGTSTTADFGKDMTIEDIENDIVPYVEKVTGDSDVQATKVEGTTQVTIKTRTLSLDERQELEDTLAENCDVDASTITSQSISSTISGEMRSDALKAVIVSCIFMLLYIWFRFKDIRFAASAILALVHDVLVVITVYALVRISVGSTFIACVLTIVGYSINDTIVIFDRIRENLALKTGKQTAEELREVANKSLTQTLSRSINTSITTFIMVVMLYILGVASIRDFSLPLMAGLVCGAYSSICIATELWYVMKVHLGKNKATK